MRSTASATSAARSAAVMSLGGASTASGVGGVDAVEADEGVEVHDSAALVLGDLAVGDPQLDPVRVVRGRCSGAA